MSRKLFICIVISVLYMSCGNKQQNTSNPEAGYIEGQCMEGLTGIIVHDIFNPPVASRFYAYCSLAYYEAFRFSDTAAKSITAQLKGFDMMPKPNPEKEYSYELAAAEAFYKTAEAFPFSRDNLSFAWKKILDKLKTNLSEDVYNNSVSFGDAIATIILKRAATDNYKKTRGMPRYMVIRAPGKWQQTPPDYADAAEPYWGKILPMLLDSASQYKPLPPPPFSLDKKSNYYKELGEVYNLSKNTNPLQDSIAHYWDDNPFVTEHSGHITYATKKLTPVGHWMGITSILCKQTKADELKIARIYAMVSCAIYDGFISCWDEKYRSLMVRPVTVIRDNIEEEWMPLLQTPPFPEYTSGHSVISSAAAAVLINAFGDISFSDTTEMQYINMKRTFSSIQHAADEACISRMYGGIHYRSAIEEGKKQGQQIGELYNGKIK